MKLLSRTEFDALPTDEAKNDYQRESELYLQSIMRGTIALSSILVEYFEILEESGYIRQRLKQVIKNSKAECIKHVDHIFDQMGDTVPSALYVEEVSKEVLKILKYTP